MYGLGVVYSQVVKIGHFRRKCTVQEFLCSGGTFLQFWAKMYRLGVFLRPAGGFWPFVRENVLARGFLIRVRYILAILAKCVLSRKFLF